MRKNVKETWQTTIVWLKNEKVNKLWKRKENSKRTIKYIDENITNVLSPLAQYCS